MSGAFGSRLKASFVVNTLGAAAIFLSQFFVAHFAGVNSFGVFAFVFAWVQIIIVIAKLGYDSAVQKLVPQYLVEGKYGLAKGVLLVSGVIVATTSTIAAMGLVAGASLAVVPVAIRDTLLAASLLLPVLVLIKLARGILLALHLPVRAQLFDPLLIYSVWMLVIAVDVIRGLELTPARIMIDLFVVASLAMLLQLVVIARALPEKVRTSAAKVDISGWFGIAIPMLFAYGFIAVITYTDTILIGFLLDTDLAGIYTVSARLAAAISMPMAFLGAVLAPAVADLVARKDRKTLQSHVRETTRMGLILAIPLVVAIGFGGKGLLGLVGETYVVGLFALYVLLAAQLVNVIVGPVGLVLLMSGQHREVGRIFAFTAATNFLLNLAFIPFFGIVGAAVATACSIIFRNLVLRAHLAKVHHLDTSVFKPA